MVKKVYFGVLVLLCLTGSALAEPGHFAYVWRLDDDGKSYLVQFDIDKDEIAREIQLPEENAFNAFIVDERGGCYIADFRHAAHYGRSIYYYDTDKKRIKHYLNLGNIFGPRYMALTGEELIVEVRGNDRSRLKSGVVFIDRKNKKIKDKIFIQEDNPRYIQANTNDLFYDGKKNLFFPSFYLEKISGKLIRETEASGDIYVVDVQKKRLSKIIVVPRKYKFIGGVFNYGDKVYVAAGTNGEIELDGWSPQNKDILVFSLEKGTLINKIPISPHPYRLACDESVYKLYVQHMDDKEERSTVEVIDIRTDKVINHLKIPSQFMFSVVAPGKMYITVGEMFLTPSRTEPALLVLDTKTDKIIKKIPGNYKGISVNPFLN